MVVLEWLKHAVVRAVKTMAQTAVALIGTAVMFQQVDWYMVGNAVALAGILSVLTSIAGLPEVQDGDNLAKILQSETACRSTDIKDINAKITQETGQERNE